MVHTILVRFDYVAIALVDKQRQMWFYPKTKQIAKNTRELRIPGPLLHYVFKILQR